MREQLEQLRRVIDAAQQHHLDEHADQRHGHRGHTMLPQKPNAPEKRSVSVKAI